MLLVFTMFRLSFIVVVKVNCSCMFSAVLPNLVYRWVFGQNKRGAKLQTEVDRNGFVALYTLQVAEADILSTCLDSFT